MKTLELKLGANTFNKWNYYKERDWWVLISNIENLRELAIKYQINLEPIVYDSFSSPFS